jgi:hypothetical protein
VLTSGRSTLHGWRRTRYALRAGAETLDDSHRAILNALRRGRYRLWRT